MDNDLYEMFQKVKYHPGSRLSDDILLYILKKKRTKEQIRLWIYSTTSIFSLIGLFPAIKLFISDITSSGFFEYVSLAISDNKAFLYWKEIALSITESIPITSLILSLTLFFIFVLSLRFIARNINSRAKLLSA